MATILLDQLWVSLQGIYDLVRILACLFQWVNDTFGNAVWNDFPVLLVCLLDSAKPPILDLQHQHAPARVYDHKIRVRVFGTNRHVIPKQIVIIKLLLKPFGQAPLAAGHA